MEENKFMTTENEFTVSPDGSTADPREEICQDAEDYECQGWCAQKTLRGTLRENDSDSFPEPDRRKCEHVSDRQAI